MGYRISRFKKADFVQFVNEINWRLSLLYRYKEQFEVFSELTKLQILYSQRLLTRTLRSFETIELFTLFC